MYVNPRRDQHALIKDGPLQGDYEPSALTSSDVDIVVGGWEWPLLKEKIGEFPALRRNAELALGHLASLGAVTGSLLDFGCGGGFFLRVAKERGWRAVGLEPLAGHAIHARAFGGVPVVTDTLRENSFLPDTFDVITAFQVFEHLPDPAADLGKLRNFLRADGLILIEVPNIDTWFLSLMGSRHRHFVQDHLNFFSEHTLRRFLIQQGFTPLSAYFPARHMTMRHFVCGWGSRFLGDGWRTLTESVLTRLRVADRIVFLGVGDIVAVVARKGR